MEGSGQLLSFFCLGIMKGRSEKCIEPLRKGEKLARMCPSEKKK